MMTVRRGLLLGSLAYLLFLLYSAPASWAVQFLQNRLPGLQLTSAQGTLWSGQARRLQYQGQTVTDLSWHWRPLALLLGRVEYQLKADWAGEPAALKVGAGLTGSTYLADVSAKIAPQILFAELLPGNVVLQGQVTMELEKVELTDQGPLPILYGQVRWPQAKVISPQDYRLGDILLELAPDEHKTLGKLTAENGQMQIDGTLELSVTGDYSLLADVRPEGALPAAVKNALDVFAENRNGQYRLDLSGNLISLLAH